MATTLLEDQTRVETITAFGRHVSSGKVQFYAHAGVNFVPGRREGIYMWDISGDKRLIDCHCNGGVFNLGHRNPAILAQLRSALDELDIGNHHLMSRQRAILAQKLAELAPGRLDYTVFGVSGGEAIDLAIKVARGYTGRPKIVSAHGGYHGHTGLALAAGDEKYYAPFGPPASGFVKIPFNDLEALDQVLDSDTAALLLETVPATYGIYVPDPDYLSRARELCDRHGALLIADEVQSGLGRTGALWAVQHYGVEPDILVTGKGLSGGLYPITATCFRAELESVFFADPFIHISTFGGSEVGCQVALKVLEISSDPAFLAHGRDMAALFAAGFAELQQKHPALLVRLRQLGLMMGIEMANEMCGPLFTKAAFEAGVLSVYANNDTRVSQLLPPLIVEEKDVAEIIARVDHALSGVSEVLGL
ncbi:MAG: aspartate aminotransferase family protein [Candidatus Promineifilaceae bacterium]|jgi:acetylornithine/succinyldiaminopimelate/putrescine aminotransferase